MELKDVIKVRDGIKATNPNALLSVWIDNSIIVREPEDMVRWDDADAVMYVARLSDQAHYNDYKEFVITAIPYEFIQGIAVYVNHDEAKPYLTNLGYSAAEADKVVEKMKSMRTFKL